MNIQEKTESINSVIRNIADFIQVHQDIKDVHQGDGRRGDPQPHQHKGRGGRDAADQNIEALRAE